MFKTIKHYLGVTGVYFKLSIMATMEYPASLLGWLLANPIQFIVGFATIKFVVAEFGSVAGWGYGELAVLYGISVISHAMGVIFFIQCRFMGYIVLEGELDRYMLRPMSVLYQFLFTEFNSVGLTDLIPGICVFIYGCIQVQLEWSLGNIINILILLLAATMIRGGIYLIIGCIVFWTKSRRVYSNYIQELFDKTTMYPLTMYPEGFQLLLTYLLPIGWVSFYPVAELLGVSNEVFTWNGAIWAALAIGLLVFAIAAWVFNRGLKHYESAGN